ncbi:MAG: VOC family protein [Pseudomonadota bacterium]
MSGAAQVRTCLWFADDGEAAAAFYVSLLPGSRIERIDRPAPDAPAVLVEFSLGGAPYAALNGGDSPQAVHDAAASICVELEAQGAADRLWEALLAHGGSPIQCGWLKDRWGVHWQVIPKGLHALLFSPDRSAEARRRAYEAMLPMQRIDLAAIEAAAEG